MDIKELCFTILDDKIYLKHCFTKWIAENSELIELLWLEIFGLENIESFYLEKEILKRILR